MAFPFNSSLLSGYFQFGNNHFFLQLNKIFEHVRMGRTGGYFVVVRFPLHQQYKSDIFFVITKKVSTFEAVT